MRFGLSVINFSALGHPKMVQEIARRAESATPVLYPGEFGHLASIACPREGPMVREYQEVGATWWCDSINGFRGSTPDLMARIDAGPPV